MRATMESLFYVIYFLFVTFFGTYLLINKKKNVSFLYIGLAFLLLGFGDLFHLVPRSIGLFSNTLDNPSDTLALWLGLGKFITSITMTFFYLLLYYFIHKRTDKKRKLYIDLIVYALIGIRIILCLLPQNKWFTNEFTLWIAIVRNIPFTILGIIIILLAFKYLRILKYYKLAYLIIILSFGFYLPVVLVANKYMWVGLLMIPKTVCYLWLAGLAFLDSKNYE